jgi:hypothetical protein
VAVNIPQNTDAEADPYYPLGTIGTVPRACDVFRAYEGMEGRLCKNKEVKKIR